MDERLKITVRSGTSLASSRRMYCEVQLVSAEGVPMGKPIRTRVCNKTSNPDWNQELIFPTIGFGGFVLSVWERHTLFPDKFLGVLTIQFNEQKLAEGGELLNDSFALSKRKPRDVVSGKIHLSVKFGTGAKVPKSVKVVPADQKDFDEPAAARQHRPLRVSSKWGLNKGLENRQQAFVVVEEDSDDENSKNNNNASTSSPLKSPSSSSGKSPRSPRDKKPSNMDSEEIDWNGTSGGNNARRNLTGAKRGSVSTKGNNGEEIDWNGTSKGTRPKRGGARPKRVEESDGSDSSSSGSSSSEEIDWNGNKAKPKKNGGDDIDWNGSKGGNKPVRRGGKASGRANKSIRTMKAREQMAEVLRLCKEEGSIVHNCRRDDTENLSFELLNKTTGQMSPVTLIIPHSIRTSEFLLFTEDGVMELGATGTIFRAMARVLENYAEQHNLIEYAPIFPKDVETPNSDTESPDPSRTNKAGRSALVESFQEAYFSGGTSLSDTSSNLVRFTEEFQNLHGKGSFGLVKLPNGALSLRFSFKPNTILSDLMAEIWQINIAQSIVVELLVQPGSITAPSVVLYQTYVKDLNLDSIATNPFGLQWYLQKRLERYLGKNWPPTASNHLFLDMLTYTIEKISVCTKTCVICDKPLEFEMLKPSICDSTLCTFSSEQYGLGQDVSAMLQYSPEVFDLLINVTVAIALRSVEASKDAKRFSPFPTGIEVTTADSSTIQSFHGKKDDCNYSLVLEVLKKLPSVKDMSLYPTTAALRKGLDKRHPLAFPLLRWILTSNRTHLAKLKPDERISQIPTPHQYLMLSATPARERIFQERKKRYGSFWAFHGSGFYNWHAILRTGLRNLSGTDLMSTGAIYGNGIYLAKDSGVSIGYAGAYNGWDLSSHGKASDMYNCMALCEVINDGYKANPYYVIPKEEDIVTRYLFIFSPAEADKIRNAYIEAANVTIPKSAFDQLITDKSRV